MPFSVVVAEAAEGGVLNGVFEKQRYLVARWWAAESTVGRNQTCSRFEATRKYRSRCQRGIIMRIYSALPRSTFSNMMIMG